MVSVHHNDGPGVRPGRLKISGRSRGDCVRLPAHLTQTDAMDPQLLALAGVVLGGLVTLAASLTSDVFRFRRVESRRWREDQLAACVNYVRLTRLVGRKAREIQESERPDKETSTRGELVVAEEDRALATEQLGMLMGLETVHRAVAVNEALWPMEVASRRGEWVETDRWNCLDVTWREAVRDFRSQRALSLA